MATTATTSTTSSTASIVKTLGSGSGLDTGAIVTALVEAQFAAKNAALNKKADTLTAQIGGVAKLKSGITGFDTALRTLVKGGSLTTQATSSNAAVATVSGTSPGLSGTLTVNRLAGAQAATTNAGIPPSDAFAPGTLNVTVGGVTTAIAIDTPMTLAGVAAKITAAGLGLTARVFAESDGSVRMTIKGETGADKAFTIDGNTPGAPLTGRMLQDLSVGNGATGTTIGTTAIDAELVLDGAVIRRGTNTIAGLLPGVSLTLTGTGTTTLGTTPPTANLAQAVNDYVATYNELHATLAAELDPVSGSLRADPAASALARALTALTTTPLATNAAGAPRTLGDIGVKTNRDGTLSVDSTRLAKVLAAYPAAVEAMFADGTGAGNGGLSAALGAITTRATDRSFGFDAESTRFNTRKSEVTTAQAKAVDDAAAMKDRLTLQFASMDSRVAAYKSTQEFMKQQVDAWNRDS